MHEKPLRVRHFRVILYPEEAELDPPAPPESLGMEKMRKKTPLEGIGCTINACQNGKLGA